MAEIAVSVATPMPMPSMERPARMRLCTTPRSAIRSPASSPSALRTRSRAAPPVVGAGRPPATRAPGPSAMTFPSERRMARGQRAASRGSWVTSRMVWPRCVQLSEQPQDLVAGGQSRLPVGSSARSRDGSATSARAIATRCRWPPDSSLGLWCMRFSRPTCLSACSARPRRSARGSPGTPAAARRSPAPTCARSAGRSGTRTRSRDCAGPRARCRPGRARRARAAGRRPPTVCRGSRGCSSACSCPNPKAP